MRATPGAPVVEHHREPLGIGESQPRLSWTVAAPAGWRQAAYEVELSRDTGTSVVRVTSPDQVLVPWPGERLRSRERAGVRVRVADQPGTFGPWSPPTTVEAGLLDPADWAAVPVGGQWPEDPDSDDRRPALVRREFRLEVEPVSARLYATAHGLYEVEINGRRVGADAMSPGWTVYPRRLRYYTYDVTSCLRAGQNAIGAWLGDGWYRGRLGWLGGFRNLFGSDLSFIGQLEVRLSDGRVQTIATDGAWAASPSPILRTGNYDGERYDAREEQPGWAGPGFDARGWTPVAIRQRDPATLVAPTGPPVRCTEEVPVAKVLTSPSGRQILDFGQNLVGRLRIRLRGERGSVVTMRTAEVLQGGEIYTRTLRSAQSTDTYILAGGEVEEWEPRFTFHGFRYVEVTGWPGDLDLAAAERDVVARVYHTDLRRTGWFECSDELLNRLHENIVWSMRGNFLDIPTDCPQRDERVGWTGDIQVFAPTASFLYDCAGMLTSWLADVAAEQLPDGTVPWYVPVIPAYEKWTPIRPGAAWGDAAVLVPWTLYQRFGDTGVVTAQYDSARRWVDLLARLAGPDRIWDGGFQLGDWLDPDAPPEDPAAGKTDKYLVATAYFGWSARHVAAMTNLLGRIDDARHYRQLADEVRAAFAQRYAAAGGRLTSDAATGYALAICFGLAADDAVTQGYGDRLAELAETAGYRVSTGFVGTPLIADALTMTGHVDTAYRLLLERDCPSWLFPVLQGATTVWERWDSLLPDGSVNPGQMTSFNHYALGSIGDWLHRVVAGLAPAAPGYREILFRPRPGGGLTAASAVHESPYGRVSIAWAIRGGHLAGSVEVPTGASAVLDLLDQQPRTLGPGVHAFG
ncbi:MAG TPA: family 78 glycoside hydrolase catalytic domain [Streptosporangiaceae bacterium]|nr:family 78 glycoside hydrolase catalytic domain [Streptosporangiaceae bacterium]